MNSFLLGIRSPTENIDKASPLPKAPRGLVLAHKRQHRSSVQDSGGRAIGLLVPSGTLVVFVKMSWVLYDERFAMKKY